ncbi:MAG TPA: dihydrofolate reductase [Burkholderiaceae bacterium]|nr:dihydrofolate reductase [Burkholderiaceae bacterium]
MSRQPRVTLLLARARNGVIGRDNTLPWHLPEDLRHFKATTMGHTIVMGRRTFESIGRTLPGRRTIVVTGDPDWAQPGAERAGSLDEAIRLASTPRSESSASEPNPTRSEIFATDELFVIGGAQLFEDALPIADRAIITEIELDVEGDVRFEAIGPEEWTLQSSEPHRSSTGLSFRIDDWVRNSEHSSDSPSASELGESR